MTLTKSNNGQGASKEGAGDLPGERAAKMEINGKVNWRKNRKSG